MPSVGIANTTSPLVGAHRVRTWSYRTKPGQPEGTSATTRIPAASTGARTVASRTVHHEQSFCPIADRAIHFEDRQEGASCPYCRIHLPKKNRTVLVTYYDDGMVVSSELAPRWPFLKRTGPILAVLLLGILIISAVASAVDDNSNSDSDSARFNGIILDYIPQNPASIAVEFQVRNAGTVSSGWECTVRAKDESNTYTGWETFNEDTPLSANNSTTAIGTVMITNEGSAYVSEVWVDGCEARATPTEPPGTSEASG